MQSRRGMQLPRQTWKKTRERMKLVLSLEMFTRWWFRSYLIFNQIPGENLIHFDDDIFQLLFGELLLVGGTFIVFHELNMKNI